MSIYIRGGESNTLEFIQNKRSYKINVFIKVLKKLQIIFQNRWVRNYKFKTHTSKCLF